MDQEKLTQMRARYVQYFARALRVWPERRVVVLQAVRMSGLNWMSGKIKGVLVLRCRPTRAAAMLKVAVVHLSQGDALLAEPWQLEGDIKIEVGPCCNRPNTWQSVSCACDGCIAVMLLVCLMGASV